MHLKKTRHKLLFNELSKELKKYSLDNTKLSDYIKIVKKEITLLKSNDVSKGQQKKDRLKIIQYFLKTNKRMRDLFEKDIREKTSFSEVDLRSFLNKKSLLTKTYEGTIDLEKEIDVFQVKLNKVKKKAKVKDYITDYLDNFYLYDDVRKMKRKIIFHMGPTNSGKSYTALQKFKDSKKACYLAPLRLLAWEIFERFNDLNISLITGEEKDIADGQTHTTSTIEMANYKEEYDLAIIDEIQMIGDAQRGWAWTKAFLMLKAKEIHLCGDESALILIQTLSKLLGDDLEVVKHERKTKLTIMDKRFSFNNLEKGDALITFSRKNIFVLKDILEKEYGKKVSVVYGMLSPDVRKKEAKRFQDGETDILISTDAIGMGLNLPIKRVIFSTLEKYYNKMTHPLSISDIKQIAGRAGRYGIEDEGFVGLLDQGYNPNSKYATEGEIEDNNRRFSQTLKRSLKQQVPEKEFAYLGPDFDNFLIINDHLEKDNEEPINLLEFYYFFHELKFSNTLFKKADIEAQVEQAEIFYHKNKDADDMDFFKFTVAPVLLRNADHLSYYENIIDYFNTESVLLFKEGISSDLEDLEITLKKLDLYCWLKNQLKANSTFLETKETLLKVKDTLNDEILKKLVTT